VTSDKENRIEGTMEGWNDGIMERPECKAKENHYHESTKTGKHEKRRVFVLS
jgi:hypothetical protein